MSIEHLYPSRGMFNCPPPCSDCGQCHPAGTVCPNLRRGKFKKVIKDAMVSNEKLAKVVKVLWTVAGLLLLFTIGFCMGIVFDFVILPK